MSRPSVVRFVALGLGLLQLSQAADTDLACRAVGDAPAKTYAICQAKTCNPLDGCPAGTIFVSATDARANFTTVQAAVRSLPNDTTAQVILIGQGTYLEQVNVTRPGPVTLLGQSNRPAKGILYADVPEGDADSVENDVQIHWNAPTQGLADNLLTSVLAVGPTWNATITGAGPQGYPVPPDTPFGCADFRAYNIDFRHTYLNYSVAPAHTVAVGYANAGFYSCGFYSYQDTVYIGKLGNAFFYDAVIAGQTDFLYGFGTMFIEHSSLLLRSCGGGVTALKGTNTTFVNTYGAYIVDSQILAANSTIGAVIKGKCSLGRPWNAGHRSLFARTYLDASILPAGYTPWGQPGGNVGPNTTMAVFDNYGPGVNITAEIASNLTMVWNETQAARYLTPDVVFTFPNGSQPNVAWIDKSIL